MQYHTYDHLGNLRVTYRRVGASLPVDATYEYSPYGRVVQTFRANTHKDRYLSTGHEREEATNYDYRLARLYDAELGRFLGVDAHKDLNHSWSPYRYAFCNPLLFIDKTGNIEWPIFGFSAMNKFDAKGGGWALKNTIIRTSPYRDTNRGAGMSNPHIGIDYRSEEGQEFYSLGDGRVVDIGETSKGAKFLSVEYDGGDIVRFLHISKTSSKLEIGSSVKEGQYLGLTGMTGAKLPHLHIDAKDKNGVEINPEGKNYGKLTNEQFFGDCKGCDSKTKTQVILQRLDNIETRLKETISDESLNFGENE